MRVVTPGRWAVLAAIARATAKRIRSIWEVWRHHQGGRHGNRPRTFHRDWHRQELSGFHEFDQRGGVRERLRGLFAGGMAIIDALLRVNAKVNVIVVTGFVTDAQKQAAMAAGATAFLCQTIHD
jgi:hypothetical protein